MIVSKSSTQVWMSSHVDSSPRTARNTTYMQILRWVESIFDFFLFSFTRYFLKKKMVQWIFFTSCVWKKRKKERKAPAVKHSKEGLMIHWGKSMTLNKKHLILEKPRLSFSCCSCYQNETKTLSIWGLSFDAKKIFENNHLAYHA